MVLQVETANYNGVLATPTVCCLTVCSIVPYACPPGWKNGRAITRFAAPPQDDLPTVRFCFRPEGTRMMGTVRRWAAQV